MRIFPAVWHEDCEKWRGQLLTGTYAHYCFDWDGLPMDETCDEWDTCHCFAKRPPDNPDVLTPGLADDSEVV